MGSAGASSEIGPGVDLLLLPSFVDPAFCASMVDEIRASAGAPATVYGTGIAPAVHTAVRSATRVLVSSDLVDAIVDRLEAARPEIARHFGRELSHCEEPQFLHYRAGDYFVAHQDGNTALIRDDTRHRRVSVVLFLNEQFAGPKAGTYAGGDLVFHGAYPDWTARHRAPASPGALVAFRAETTHEVTPVIHGDRFTVASWYR
jgi:SM-20-related protein